VLSAGLSGLAGSTKAIVFTFVTLTDADWHTSGDVELMTLLGGVGTLFGPVVGAFSIITLESELSDRVGPLVTVITGIIFIVCVLVFRRGVIGEVAGLYNRVVGNRRAFGSDPGIATTESDGSFASSNVRGKP
jgi:branched-chain amino acid transport system permease protein